mgnify:FL=1|uniref:Uncharacterized protein n=1 Tax=uncultured prokaryote TaxID=198431 RepID=A0A0H5Q2U1_9ZZZZ|nr:hypothetical protein [uncultured prokaryote]
MLGQTAFWAAHRPQKRSMLGQSEVGKTAWLKAKA